MEVILLENIRRVGKLGDKISLKAGFARNYLIPQNKAVYATPDNIRLFEERRAELENKAQAELVRATQRAADLQALTLVIAALASDEGKLYGSVGVTEIHTALQEKGIEIHKNEIIMQDGTIHATGEYQVEIVLHSDVTAQVQLHVIATK